LLVLVFLCLVPVPLGSNRPLFWAINAGVVSILGLVYGVSWLLSGESLRVKLRELGVVPWAFGGLCLYLLVQMLPLPGLPFLSVTPGATFLMLLRTLTHGVFFFLVLQISRNPERAHHLLNVALAALTAHAILALAMLRTGDTLLGYEKLAYLGSATGTFINRNSFATFLAFGCVLAFAKLLADLQQALSQRDRYAPERPWLQVSLAAFALAAMSATIVATQSRMGVAAALIGLLVVGARSVPAIRTRRISVLVVAIVLLALIGLVVVLNSDGLLQRLLFADQSWAERLELYRQVVELISIRPFTGFGGGSFNLAFTQVHHPPLSIDRVWDKAHNSYLTLLSELGLVAGLLIPLMLFAITWRLMRTPKASTAERLPVTVALGVMAVAASHSLVDFSLEIQAVTLWFVALVACGVAQALYLAANQSALDDPDSDAG
jgi:O-antigen ligase